MIKLENVVPANVINIFALFGVSTLIVAIGIFLWIFANEIKDHIRMIKYRKKREYDIAHRFEKKPLASCHCIDCKYCQGFISEKDWEPRAISCYLWGRSMVTYDNSFCYRADPRK